MRKGENVLFPVVFLLAVERISLGLHRIFIMKNEKGNVTLKMYGDCGP